MNLHLEPKTAQSETDWNELVVRTGTRDLQALAELHAASKHAVIAVVHRMIRDLASAEEAVQDVYRHVWLHARQFDAERGSALSWLRMIARSRAIDKLRAN